MNIKNWFPLTIRSVDFNLVAKQDDFLAQLRELTIGPYSGLNYELNKMLVDSQVRNVNCQILSAYRFKELVGWAILSKEDTDFFYNSMGGFQGSDGWMFQLFVEVSNRRTGVGTKLYQTALQAIGNEVLYVSPHDDASYAFYDALPLSNRKEL